MTKIWNKFIDWLFPKQESEYDAATRRWKEHNAKVKADGCRCGKPATVVEYNYNNYGAVPVEFWSCEEHKDVVGWTYNAFSDTWRPSAYRGER